MKTIRRNMLRKLVESGGVVVVETYHFDDMMGESRTNREMPCAVQPADWKDRKQGVCYIFDHAFESGSGSCYQDEVGLIHLHVHSNSSYTFRLVNGASVKPVVPGMGKRPENVRMQNFLAQHGITAKAKYIPDGSMRGTWRLSHRDTPWTLDLAAKINSLGFVDYDNKPLGQWSGNGGLLCIFVRGHDELLQEPVAAESGAA